MGSTNAAVGGQCVLPRLLLLLEASFLGTGGAQPREETSGSRQTQGSSWMLPRVSTPVVSVPLQLRALSAMLLGTCEDFIPGLQVPAPVPSG